MGYSQIQDYKAQAVSSMSKGEQLILLYEEALKNLKYSCVMLEKKNYDTFFKCTKKSKDVFTYLLSILNFNYELSNNLFDLYNFFNKEIIRAEVEKNSEPIESIIPMVSELKDAWVQADKELHKNKNN